MDATMEMKKFEAELEQTCAVTTKLQAETMKIQTGAKWYPFIAGAGAGAAMLGAAIGLVKLFS
jgi:hypothetical protein